MAGQLGSTERERQRQEQERRTASARRLLATLPIALMVIFTILWAIPATRDIATGRDERNPVEFLTFVFMLVAAVLALRLSARMWRLGHAWWVVGFFVLFGVGAFIVAMDEVSWGRVFLNMFESADTPVSEPTAVDLTGLREHTEIFRLVFAIGGIAGVFLDRSPKYRILAAPKELLPWLVVIGLVSLVDLIGDIVQFTDDLQEFFVRSSELIEMMIGMVSVLYVYFKMRALWWRIP